MKAAYFHRWVVLSVLTLSLAGCHRAGLHSAQGEVEVQQEQLAKTLPPALPKTLYVADFRLDTADFQGDQGVRGALPGGLQQRVAGLGTSLPTPLATGDPAAAAQRIVTVLAEDIATGLRAQKVPAQRLGPAADPLPQEGWLVSGVFTEVDEGNRIRRAVLGLGQGATQMAVQVGLSDLTSRDPRAAFAVFGTIKNPSHLPGAAVTLNPYVAAAKFVMERNATSEDVQATAQRIVTELLKFWDRVRQQRSR